LRTPSRSSLIPIPLTIGSTLLQLISHMLLLGTTASSFDFSKVNTASLQAAQSNQHDTCQQFHCCSRLIIIPVQGGYRICINGKINGKTGRTNRNRAIKKTETATTPLFLFEPETVAASGDTRIS
jgi:hypothetical protein